MEKNNKKKKRESKKEGGESKKKRESFFLALCLKELCVLSWLWRRIVSPSRGFAGGRRKGNREGFEED